MRFALTGLLVTAWIVLVVYLFDRSPAAAWLLVLAAGILVALVTKAWRRERVDR